MTELEKFHLINQCETANALKNAILSIADEDGLIGGRVRKWEAKKLADNVDYVMSGQYPANILTRAYGIRQQALYLSYCIYMELKR